MTNDELNQYIRHYIEKDKTGRAIMLTGAWGIGKSFYIRNDLIPFLSKPENGNHECIVVSLYGLSSLSEVSKAIYFEARVKILNRESEVGKATFLIAKTVLKGISSYFGIDLSSNEKDLQALYQSIDLSNKLVIIEDVERTSIDILELLGFVNSLTEQDHVKVLLVTNEKEIIQYRPTEKKNTVEKAASNWAAGFSQPGDSRPEKEYTEKTLRYLETKEKSVSDSINYSGELKSAVKAIIQSFDCEFLNKFATDQDTSNIVEIMYLMGSENLRSVIFACQKTADIFEIIYDQSLSEDFLKSIFYGIIAFSLRIHCGGDIKWVGLEQYSLELGIHKYPLFRFCYDYILTQRLDISLVPAAVDSLEKLRLYDKNKSTSDPDLQNLYHFHLLTDADAIEIVKKITSRLNNPEDISFYEYSNIAIALVRIKHVLGIEIGDAKELLVQNLRGRNDGLSAEDLFWNTMSGGAKEEQEEFIALREEMISALAEKKSFIPDFEYLPEQAQALYDYIIKNPTVFYEAHGFAKNINIPRFIEMYSRCTSAQMDCIRGTFNAVYRPVNVRDTLADDLIAIEELLTGIKAVKESANADKIQRLQYEWFISVLSDVKNKLSST